MDQIEFLVDLGQEDGQTSIKLKDKNTELLRKILHNERTGLKTRKVNALLDKLGIIQSRQRGSHKNLLLNGRAFTLSHHGENVDPAFLNTLVEEYGQFLWSVYKYNSRPS